MSSSRIVDYLTVSRRPPGQARRIHAPTPLGQQDLRFAELVDDLLGRELLPALRGDLLPWPRAEDTQSEIIQTPDQRNTLEPHALPKKAPDSENRRAAETLHDADLATVIDRWPAASKAIRRAIVSLINSDHD